MNLRHDGRQNIVTALLIGAKRMGTKNDE